MNETKAVAMIGAGLAGLACARVLQGAGMAVTVFDKSRGVGGRLCTRRGEDWQADHGAQYFTARSPEFQALVAKWLEAGVVAEWRPQRAVFGPHEASAGEAVRRYVGVPGMSAPAKALAAGLTVRTGYTVQALRRVDGGWQLDTAEHGLLPEVYQAVLLGVPAAQAEPLLRPVQVSLADVAAGHRLLPSWTVMARFDARPDLPFEAAFVNEGPLRWVARNSSKPGRTGRECWVLQASAVWSAAHLEEVPETAGRMLVAAFRALGGPEPAAVSVHRWRYADCEPATTGSVWQPESGLGLCGDWLLGGRVEGAWTCGRELGGKVLADLR
jgi:predicted NAD/FAD-dependent oxidoreductase